MENNEVAVTIFCLLLLVTHHGLHAAIRQFVRERIEGMKTALAGSCIFFSQTMEAMTWIVLATFLLRLRLGELPYNCVLAISIFLWSPVYVASGCSLTAFAILKTLHIFCFERIQNMSDLTIMRTIKACTMSLAILLPAMHCLYKHLMGLHLLSKFPFWLYLGGQAVEERRDDGIRGIELVVPISSLAALLVYLVTACSMWGSPECKTVVHKVWSLTRPFSSNPADCSSWLASHPSWGVSTLGTFLSLLLLTASFQGFCGKDHTSPWGDSPYPTKEFFFVTALYWFIPVLWILLNCELREWLGKRAQSLAQTYMTIVH